MLTRGWLLVLACGRGLEMRGEKGEPWTEVLSWEPRAFVYHNFLVSPLPHSFLFGGKDKDHMF